MLRQRNVVTDQRPYQAAQATVAITRAIEVPDIPAVLAMHPRAHAGERGRHLRLQGAEVPGMDDVRPQGTQHLPQSDMDPRVLAFALVQGMQADIVAPDAQAEVGVVRHANDGVAKAIRRHMVDQVDQPVLHPANVQAVDHVRDAGPGIPLPDRFGNGSRHCRVTVASRSRMPGRASAA